MTLLFLNKCIYLNIKLDIDKHIDVRELILPHTIIILPTLDIPYIAGL
jgi:hypothetical protein